ncbi:nicotinate-nucleotide--dimethylbenzimidazole phosphoribosyltransferase [Polycyclovorans algicola]|uniref:nicotinate-nucleotide--dimethylbenzimidazole phosphoribosyltransferase n=1 Tax=Polycyclovorans algicola TaxID=616992 RepID=UPI0004A6B1E4|nr:nicotinate-nucleotide--dimethylbenzimidazole phosphoribosyltransferase [Polycyclovorans algicola]
MNDPDWLNRPVRLPDEAIAERALQHQAQLTKPPGSLGRLEGLAVRLAAMQRRERPRVDTVHISIFAADHGVAAEGVSAFPQAVTAQMIDNFAAGGAAISVLARQLGASLEVIDLGTVVPSTRTAGVVRHSIAPGTANLSRTAAMTDEQLGLALRAGREAVVRAVAQGADLWIGGEMGIGNTTAATALACALLGAAPATLTGRGTGIDDVRLQHKVRVIERALALHAGAKTPLALLRCLGGFEIAALVGAIVTCAQRGLPVLVDGFIVSVAALLAVRVNPRVATALIFAHRSAEAGHQSVLAALNAQPLLDLDLRLGEASGAALAVPLLRLACALHREMATFATAGVSASDERQP